MTIHVTRPGYLDTPLSTRARLQPWYQPNFIRVNKYYVAASIPPHGATCRWSYTVPTNRLAISAASHAQIVRQTAPTTPGLAGVILWINTLTRLPDVVEVTSTVGVPKLSSLGHSFIAVPGDVIQGVTSDGSVGGLYFYSLCANFMEFDA